MKHISVLFVLILLSTFSVAKGKTAKAKDFTLKSSVGKNIRLSEQRGNIIMLNFWATWCAPCRKEMPLLEQIYKDFKRKGFILYGVNVEETDNKSIRKKVDKFIKDKKVSFPILYDAKGKVSEAYKVEKMPTSVIIDCNGNVSYVHKGYSKGDEHKYIEHIDKAVKAC